jgi:hypothetical protein
LSLVSMDTNLLDIRVGTGHEADVQRPSQELLTF